MSHSRGAQEDVTTKSNVHTSNMITKLLRLNGILEQKKDIRQKLRKSEYIWTLVNYSVTIFVY